MSTTYSDAIDEMQGMISEAWTDGEIEGILGYQPSIYWPGVPNAVAPDNSKVWARPSFQTVIDEQKTLTNEIRIRRFQCTGLMYLQIFCPKDEPNTVVNGRQIAEYLRNIFRHSSPSSNIWFQRQEVRELPPTDQLYPFNVKVTFNFETAE